jgi:hypothetical protein
MGSWLSRHDIRRLALLPYLKPNSPFNAHQGPHEALAYRTQICSSVPGKRNLHAYGSLLELVRFTKFNDGPNQPTAEEVDQWIESMPMQVLSR